jgi:hypothetical protein
MSASKSPEWTLEDGFRGDAIVPVILWHQSIHIPR